MTIYIFVSQGQYYKAALEQHYSSSVSELVARLLVTDPERRPSASEVLENLTVQKEPGPVTSPENKALSQDTLLATSGSASSEGRYRI